VVWSNRAAVLLVDLAKFFERVNHDILSTGSGGAFEDATVFTDYRAYMNAGIRMAGVRGWSWGWNVTQAHAQGGQLSPLIG